MGFAGLFAMVVGIVMLTLAANGRWPAMWAAMTGGAATAAPPASHPTTIMPSSNGPGTGTPGGW